MEHGFEMNDEMAAFLENSPEFEVQIVTLKQFNVTCNSWKHFC